jgi:hypothetical protein
MNGKLQPFRRIERAADAPAQIIGITVQLNPSADQTLGSYPERERWENDEYSVWLDKHSRHELGAFSVWHMAIRRKDQEPATDWRDLQAIKSILVGPEFEAIELFPAEMRVMDVTNETHLYALMTQNGDPVRIPVGRFGRREVNSLLVGQRPL